MDSLFWFYFEDFPLCVWKSAVSPPAGRASCQPTARRSAHRSMKASLIGLMCLNSDLILYLREEAPESKEPELLFKGEQTQLENESTHGAEESAGTLMSLAVSNEARKLLSSRWWIHRSLIGLKDPGSNEPTRAAVSHRMEQDNWSGSPGGTALKTTSPGEKAQCKIKPDCYFYEQKGINDRKYKHLNHKDRLAQTSDRRLHYSRFM